MEVVNVNNSSLDKGNAYWMAKISYIVYEKQNELAHTIDNIGILNALKLEDHNFIDVYGFSKNSTQAILVEHKDFFCFAFRGTDHIQDWWDNLKIIQFNAGSGCFHKGFWDSLDDVYYDLMDRYRELSRTKRRPLFLTGHSLGGAMTTVAVARLLHDSIDFVSAYTFGQPRAAEIKTALKLNQRIKDKYFRFQNNNDIVTRVPSALAGLKHVGTFIYIDEDKQMSDSSNFFIRFMDYLDGLSDEIFKKGLDMINDHGMNHYYNAICQWKLK